MKLLCLEMEEDNGKKMQLVHLLHPSVVFEGQRLGTKQNL